MKTCSYPRYGDLNGSASGAWLFEEVGTTVAPVRLRWNLPAPGVFAGGSVLAEYFSADGEEVKYKELIVPQNPNATWSIRPIHNNCIRKNGTSFLARVSGDYLPVGSIGDINTWELVNVDGHAFTRFVGYDTGPGECLPYVTLAYTREDNSDDNATLTTFFGSSFGTENPPGVFAVPEYCGL
eukprot:CAMPEP_0116999326 /NCGR_PEP_ID=MMETSP0472-20121206/2072_1 /TAXON_ID=693140 ORGANISM="Tiarina fusus, Strain LIS" /NCGR_SAMPLE_ID=MMETSP0472 /ASSEMBLY_ACC=CAM_ASM_000603 /LENGTH=181 /DNA_ID=CAMNT_0004698715 /DNA_START=45 /DNA_END=590 /DNA_ORIENTATION=-